MLTKFKQELSYIKTDWIRSLTEKVINHIPEYFFEIPASSTGKYHPEYSLGQGGLLRHTKAACKIAYDVLHLESVNKFLIGYHHEYNMSDAIIAALILHDACKSGYPLKAKYTKHEHPLLAADLIRDSLEIYLSESELDDADDTYNQIKWYIDTVCNLVSSHMGEWNTNSYSKTKLPKPESNEEILVHIFDYLASRKYITIVLDE